MARIDFDTMINRLRACRQEMEATRQIDALKIGLDAVAAIKVRVQNEGLNAEGQSFGVYTEQYQKWRAKNNLTAAPFPLVNFKKTTAMWNSTTANVTFDGNGVTEVRILPEGADDQGVSNLDKMRWNEERFGPILDVSQAERDMIQAAVTARYIKLFKKYELLL